MSVADASEKWGVSIRQVQRLLALGRIPRAKKYGRSWMIPDDAEKPADPRLKKGTSELASDLAYLIEATAIPLSLYRIDAILETISEERVRLYVEGYLAYMRGDYERTIQYFRKIGYDDAAKLRACSLAIAAAISTGNYPLYQEIESYCKGMVLAANNANVKTIAELALATAYVNAFAPDMVPNWLKEGDFSALPHQLKPEALCTRTRYLHFLKKYESVLDVAQTALTLYEPGHGISHMGIYMRLTCAVACCSLGRSNDAKDYLLGVMKDCLPNGFITPFAENAPLFGGLLEQCLEQEFPSFYDAVTKQSKRTIPNWLAFHNRFTKENITLILSMREYQIALLAMQGVPYKKIAEQHGISVGRLKNIMLEIYEKLFISGRDELSQYIL